MQIVIDTNIILHTKERLLGGPQIETIRSLRDKTPVDIVVPEIVRAEAVNKFREFYRTRRLAFEKAHRAMLAMLPVADLTLTPIPTEDEATRQYEDALNERLSQLGVIVPTYPDVSHDDLVRRCLGRRKPFDSSGKGYRDALIWEIVLSLASADDRVTVVLVTQNSQDFSDGRGNLHEHLREDLKRLGLSEDAVRLSSSLDEVVCKHLLPTQEQIESIKGFVESGAWQEFRDAWEGCHDEIVQQIREKCPLEDGAISRILGVEVSGSRVQDLDRNVQDDELETEVRLIDEDRAYVVLPCRILATIEFLANKNDCGRLTQYEHVRIENTDWDANSALLSAEIEFELAIAAYMDRRNHDVLGWDVTYMKPVELLT